MKPTLYMLIGIPGSGKSTWVKDNAPTDAVVLSTDDFVQDKADELRTTYDAVFHDVIQQATVHMERSKRAAISDSKCVVWDQTNLTKSSRKRKLLGFEDYHKVAVVFDIPEREELYKRLASRPDKTIPLDVIESMISQFQIPSSKEGFDEVIYP